MAREQVYRCNECGAVLKKAYVIKHFYWVFCDNCGVIWKIDFTPKKKGK